MAEKNLFKVLTGKYKGAILEYLIWQDPGYLVWLSEIRSEDEELGWMWKSKPHIMLFSRARWLVKQLDKLKPVKMCAYCGEETITTIVVEMVVDRKERKCYFPKEGRCGNTACYPEGDSRGTILESYPAEWRTVLCFKHKSARERWLRLFFDLCGYQGKLIPKKMLEFLESHDSSSEPQSKPFFLPREKRQQPVQLELFPQGV